MYLKIKYNYNNRLNKNILSIYDHQTNKLYEFNNNIKYLQIPYLIEKDNFFTLQYSNSMDYLNDELIFNINDCEWKIPFYKNNFTVDSYTEILININTAIFNFDIIDIKEYDRLNFFCHKNTYLAKPRKIIIDINGYTIDIDNWTENGLCKIGYSKLGDSVSILHTNTRSNLCAKLKNIPFVKNQSINLFSSVQHKCLFNELGQTNCNNILPNFSSAALLNKTILPLHSKCIIDCIKKNIIKIITLYD